VCSAVYCAMLQADVSANVIAGLRADVAVANSIIEDLKDVALDALDAVTTIEHIASEVP
jgi:hypothetical protein